jgi:hypothetical protein
MIKKPEMPYKFKQTNLFAHNYITHPHMQFGDLDTTCEGERANVLFALRELTGNWQGEIEYDPKQDKVQPHGTLARNQPNLLQWRVWGILVTGYNPTEPKDKSMFMDLWSLPPPKAIIYQHLQGQSLYIRRDLFKEHKIRQALNQNPVLCSDTNEEVELILRDSAWEHTVKQDIEAAFVHLWNNNLAGHKKLCGWIVDHNEIGAGVCCVPSKHLKEAFWKYLTERNDFGNFENTTWEGFTPQDAAVSMIPILEKIHPRTRAMHT